MAKVKARAQLANNMVTLSQKEKEILYIFSRTKECEVLKDIFTRRLDEAKNNLVKTNGDNVFPLLQGKARELEDLIKLLTITT